MPAHERLGSELVFRWQIEICEIASEAYAIHIRGESCHQGLVGEEPDFSCVIIVQWSIITYMNV